MAIAGLIVLGLATGVWLLWPRGDPAGSTTTAAAVAEPTTTLRTDPQRMTTTLPDPTTTIAESHVVETVEEAEAILRELWFGWFEGIYNQDEDRIRQVVATEEQVEAAVSAFGAEFINAPTADGVVLMNTEILHSDEHCLVTWGGLDVRSFRGPDARTESVVVLRNVGGPWLMLSTWVSRNDLWRTDCDVVLPSSS